MSDKKLINLGNHNQKSLNDCNEKGIPNIPETDPPGNEKELGWLEDASNKKIGLGKANQCDPFQTGQIINSLKNPNRNVLYRYSKSLRASDEAMLDLFKNLVVIDENGKAHNVPIIWASQEKAVAAILQDNVRKDNSLVVDRVKLPMLAIYASDYSFNQDRYTYHKAKWILRQSGKPGFTENEKYNRDTVFGVSRGIPIDITYTLFAWTMYLEDMNQILEQILSKFSPIAYIDVRGVLWETIVKLNSVSNNLDVEPGDQSIRVIKFQFNMVAETYISQPIKRDKAVLKINTNFFNNTEVENVDEVIDRIEEVVKELEE